MQVIKIADAVVADTNTDFELPPAYGDHQEMVLQVDISGTFSITAQGRISPDAAWVELVAAATASYIQPLTFMPHIRLVSASGASTPILDAWIMVGDSVRV